MITFFISHFKSLLHIINGEGGAVYAVKSDVVKFSANRQKTKTNLKPKRQQQNKKYSSLTTTKTKQTLNTGDQVKFLSMKNMINEN